MPLEKAFMINGPPEAIWRALTGDLEIGDESAYDIEESTPFEVLSLWLDLQSGVRARLTYRLIPRGTSTEVVATMEPEGLRYTIFRMITLGQAEVNYEMMLVEGLANLKATVEGSTQST